MAAVFYIAVGDLLFVTTRRACFMKKFMNMLLRGYSAFILFFSGVFADKFP